MLQCEDAAISQSAWCPSYGFGKGVHHVYSSPDIVPVYTAKIAQGVRLNLECQLNVALCRTAPKAILKRGFGNSGKGLTDPRYGSRIQHFAQTMQSQVSLVVLDHIQKHQRHNMSSRLTKLRSPKLG